MMTGGVEMSNYNICRDCEHNVSNDAELCLDCAESKFIDLMRDDSVWRSEMYSGEYTFDTLEQMDDYKLAVFEAWCAKDPTAAGKLVFAVFDEAFKRLRFDGDL
jgi:Mlc titration factor MtfA (ptsG expression regulator)